MPVAGDVGKRASEDARASLIDPEGPDRAGENHLSRQREVLAAQYQAVGTDRAVGTGDRPLGTGLGTGAGPAISRRPAGQGPGGWPSAMS